MGTIDVLIRGNSIRVFSSVGLERYLDRVESRGFESLNTHSIIERLSRKIASFFMPLFVVITEPELNQTLIF